MFHLYEAPGPDFSMYQSSHGGHDHDYGLSPTKPTLDGVPRSVDDGNGRSRRDGQQ